MGSPRTKWCQIGTRSHFRTLFFFGTLKAAPISISIPHHFEQIMKTRVFSDNFNLLCQGTTSEAQLFEVVSDRTTSLAPRTIFESHLPEKVSAKIALNFHIFFPQKHLTLYSKPQLKKKNPFLQQHVTHFFVAQKKSHRVVSSWFRIDSRFFGVPPWQKMAIQVPGQDGLLPDLVLWDTYNK